MAWTLLNHLWDKNRSLHFWKYQDAYFKVNPYWLQKISRHNESQTNVQSCFCLVYLCCGVFFYDVHCRTHDKTFLIVLCCRCRHDYVFTLIALTPMKKVFSSMSSHPGSCFSIIPFIVVNFPSWNWSGRATTPPPIMMPSTSFNRVLKWEGKCFDVYFARRATRDLISLWSNENTPKILFGIVVLGPYIRLVISSGMHNKFFVYSLWPKAN